MPKFITIGIMERYIPLVDGRVVTWTTWERDRANVKGSATRPFIDVGDGLRQRWRDLLGKPTCVTGYRDMMDAMEVIEKVELWAAEAVFDLEELLECEVRPMFFATKDGTPMSGIPPRGTGPDTRPDQVHPFHFDNDVLKNDTAEAAIEEARVWYRWFAEESEKINKSYGKNGGLEWVATATDDRISK